MCLGCGWQAAVCRGGRYTQAIPKALVGLLSSFTTDAPSATDEQWLSVCAHGVGVLMAPPAPDLRKEAGARLAPLLAQRLYVTTAPALRAELDGASGDGGSGGTTGKRPSPMAPSAVRLALLDGLMLCLVHAPSASLLAQPATAVPYVLMWLQHAVAQLERLPIDAPVPSSLHSRCRLFPAVLRMASRLVRQLSEADAEPLGELLPVLLCLLPAAHGPVAPRDAPPPAASLARLGSSHVEAVEAAIDCLDAARALPYHRLVPHKRKVLKALESALDHRKRRVRQAARLCVNNWHLLAR